MGILNEMELCVIMPLYNEQESIKKTVEEWLSAIREEKINFHLLLINDGSKDNSYEIIQQLASDNREIIVTSSENQGHGKSCYDGYKYAIEKQYSLIMQLDSDGQCDPKYFKTFYSIITSDGVDAVYGIRYYRKDGWVRYFVSRIVSVVAWLRVGVWVFDPNVPYRLFKSNSISNEFKNFKAIDLFNVFLALYHKKHCKVRFTSIVFRDRWGGSPSVKLGGLFYWAKNFWQQMGKV